jgi:hypothetical protein
MDELNYITRSKYSCDSCGAEGPTALYHHRGAPVLSQCGVCDPKGWEKAKDAPLEEWTAEPADEPEGNFYSDRYGDW